MKCNKIQILNQNFFREYQNKDKKVQNKYLE